LLGKDFRRAAMEEGRVNKRVKPAVRERFHGTSLTTKHTKHTKEFADSENPFRRSAACLKPQHFQEYQPAWKVSPSLFAQVAAAS
jgi:hypothetical protein